MELIKKKHLVKTDSYNLFGTAYLIKNNTCIEFYSYFDFNKQQEPIYRCNVSIITSDSKDFKKIGDVLLAMDLTPQNDIFFSTSDEVEYLIKLLTSVDYTIYRTT